MLLTLIRATPMENRSRLGQTASNAVRFSASPFKQSLKRLKNEGSERTSVCPRRAFSMQHVVVRALSLAVSAAARARHASAEYTRHPSKSRSPSCSPMFKFSARGLNLRPFWEFKSSVIIDFNIHFNISHLGIEPFDFSSSKRENYVCR